MSRIIALAFGAAALVAVAIAVTRHLRPRLGHAVPGGTLMNDAGAYDAWSRRLLGPLFRGIAADIAAGTPPNARILEVGCGPGHLSARLARDHDLDIIGVDLDPAMIDRARANAEALSGPGRRPTFVVADAAALPFADGSFDLVVSTMSMHHWDDAVAGLAEIARVLGPQGRALIWDLRRNAPLFFHGQAPDPVAQVERSPMRIVSSAPWRWPWRISLTERIEMANAAA